MEKGHSLFSKFVGARRWKALFQALKREFEYPFIVNKGALDLILVLVLCALGPVTAALEIKYEASSTLQSTLAFGISAVFAILFQRSIERKAEGASIKDSFALTHTAFALGCVPALIVVALDPTLLAKREQLLNSSSQGGGVQVSKAMFVFYIGLFTLWVAVTEEYLFRGLLISVVRRCNLFKTPRIRTVMACALSSILFGAAHYAMWGAGASLALTGIGLGLALGYVANGEKIWPMIIYHWGFDFLSTSIALLR